MRVIFPPPSPNSSVLALLDKNEFPVKQRRTVNNLRSAKTTAAITTERYSKTKEIYCSNELRFIKRWQNKGQLIRSASNCCSRDSPSNHYNDMILHKKCTNKITTKSVNGRSFITLHPIQHVRFWLFLDFVLYNRNRQAAGR